MKKYLHELKQVTWPESSDVLFNFWIVVFGIVLLALFFFIADASITKVFDALYS